MVSQHSQWESKATSSLLLPRVLIVSRRTLRKNKFVDFVGEYHLNLIVQYGAIPVIVPRVSGVEQMLDSFEPIHGVLLCEGEDVDPLLYNDTSDLSEQELEEIRRLHSSDTAVDRTKDSIELELVRRCLERNIPYLGICRGSQVLNVASGGTLYQDVEKELLKTSGCDHVKHINYDDYDGHRHPLTVVDNTPLHSWFQSSFKSENDKQIMVNSYHHQGIKRLAERFKPMAYSPDGLIEAFYDPNLYNPQEGKFIVGLQFHPERMRHQNDTEPFSESVFDYPGCPRAYQEFVKAVFAYQKSLLPCGEEKKNKRIVRSFSISKLRYEDPGALLIKLTLRGLDKEEENRLKQMGATVRNSASYIKNVKMNKERRETAIKLMESMSTQQLSDLVAFYEIMIQTGSVVLEERRTRSVT